MGDGSVECVVIAARTLRCPHCSRVFGARQFLTQHLIAFHDQERQEPARTSLKIACQESAAHILMCPALEDLASRVRSNRRVSTAAREVEASSCVSLSTVPPHGPSKDPARGR